MGVTRQGQLQKACLCFYCRYLCATRTWKNKDSLILLYAVLKKLYSSKYNLLCPFSVSVEFYGSRKQPYTLRVPLSTLSAPWDGGPSRLTGRNTRECNPGMQFLPCIPEFGVLVFKCLLCPPGCALAPLVPDKSCVFPLLLE